MSGRQPDVLIIGAGVTGLCSALYLLRAGRSVRLLERGQPGSGASHGNCGTITPSHAAPLAAPGMVGQALRWMLTPDAPLYIRPRLDPALWRWLLAFARRCNPRQYESTLRAKGALLLHSRELLETLVAEEGLDCEFSPSGLSYVFRTDAALREVQRELPLLAALGVDASVVDGARLQREQPALLPGLAGAIHFPGDARLRPDRYVAELARRVLELGGEISSGCEVSGFDIVGGRLQGVHAAGRVWRAPRVLLATGAWAPRLLPRLRLHRWLQPGKGYSMTYARPSQVPGHPLVLKERSVCVTAWDNGFRLGSTMEFSGYDTKLNAVRLGALARGAAEYLKEPIGPGTAEAWYGWRPMSLDDLPLIGPAPGVDGLHLALGHGMMGVGMSAATGAMVADQICGRSPAIDSAPFDPRRFATGSAHG